MACLLNWNNARWTVLQQRSRNGPWVHTNSVVGPASFHGRSTFADVLALRGVVQAIQGHHGGVTLHKISRTDGLGVASMLPAQGLQAVLPPEMEQQPMQEGRSAVSFGNQARLVSLNVDGLGEYDKAPAARMATALGQRLASHPTSYCFKKSPTRCSAPRP